MKRQSISSAKILLYFSHRDFVGIFESTQRTNEWVLVKDLISYISN